MNHFIKLLTAFCGSALFVYVMIGMFDTFIISDWSKNTVIIYCLFTIAFGAAFVLRDSYDESMLYFDGERDQEFYSNWDDED